MDAIKYFRIKNRMTKGCKYLRDCSQCVLNADDNHYEIDCEQFELQHPEEAVAAVEKWAEEHPVKTRKDKFLEMYPNAFVNTVPDGTFVDICPLDVNISYGKCNLQSEDINDCLLCKISYWNEEVE